MIEATSGVPPHQIRNSPASELSSFPPPMLDPVRQEIAATSSTVVVKVGTRVLTHADGTLDHDRVTAIAEQLVWLIEEQRQVVLVSSGAVGAGIGRLGLRRAADRSGRSAGRGRRRPKPAHRGLQPGARAAWPLRRPDPAHGRRPQRPDAVPQRPQHAPGGVSSTARSRSSTKTTRSGSTSSSATSATTTASPRWSRTCCGLRCSCCSRTSTACSTVIRASRARN